MTFNHWENAVNFHGHACPGLAMGVRASRIALEKLEVMRAEDEELVAIVETDSCAVDGIQVLTGCTFGKGNLFLKDYGKNAFTIARRSTDNAYRVVFYPLDLSEKARKLREKVTKGIADQTEKGQFQLLQQKIIKKLLEDDAKEFCKVEETSIILPKKARIFNSIKCEECGEFFMEPRGRRKDGKNVCLGCFQEYTR